MKNLKIVQFNCKSVNRAEHKQLTSQNSKLKLCSSKIKSNFFYSSRVNSRLDLSFKAQAGSIFFFFIIIHRQRSAERYFLIDSTRASLSSALALAGIPNRLRFFQFHGLCFVKNKIELDEEENALKLFFGWNFTISLVEPCIGFKQNVQHPKQF